jgi:Phage capsid family
MRVDLPGYSGVKVPSRILLPDDAGSWIGEGLPIRVLQTDFSAGPTVVPYKVAAIIVLTRELAEHSSAENVFKQMLSESAALLLDAKMFSADALAAGISPAGLLDGVTPVAAATAGGGLNALNLDSKLLVGALANKHAVFSHHGPRYHDPFVDRPRS